MRARGRASTVQQSRTPAGRALALLPHISTRQKHCSSCIHAAPQVAATAPPQASAQRRAPPRPTAASPHKPQKQATAAPWPQLLPLSQAVNAPVDAAGRLTRHLDKLVVVARYREDIGWLDALRPRIPFLVYQVGHEMLIFAPDLSCLGIRHPTQRHAYFPFVLQPNLLCCAQRSEHG
jgi:hypothetical protein